MEFTSPNMQNYGATKSALANLTLSSAQGNLLRQCNLALEQPPCLQTNISPTFKNGQCNLHRPN
eukprot:1159163-Pelagomonas_calceolata.AAC.6